MKLIALALALAATCNAEAPDTPSLSTKDGYVRLSRTLTRGGGHDYMWNSKGHSYAYMGHDCECSPCVRTPPPPDLLACLLLLLGEQDGSLVPTSVFANRRFRVHTPRV